MTKARPRIAIIGAGPIGLEAALFAAEAGHDVYVFERGRIAANVAAWGHVRLFSPFGINASSWGLRALADNSSERLRIPNADAILTGREFAERYLLPLSRLPQLASRIYERTEVVALGRSRTWKRELIGRPERGRDPFQLLLRDADGERTVEADCVFDCSGTYPHHNWLGAGGIPCAGEQAAATEINYTLPDILGADRGRFTGTKTLVVGSGYSAAAAVVSLAAIARESQHTRVVWLTRTDRTPPIPRIDNDALPERDALAETANQLALSANGPVEWLRQAIVRGVEHRPGGGFRVAVERRCASTNLAMESKLLVDHIIATVGYKPNRSLYEELQVHECYASQGPMKLAAALLGEMSADCLAQQGQGAATLLNPEPGFFILGAKSYGRDSRFLIKVGLEQIRDVFSLLAASASSAVNGGE